LHYFHLFGSCFTVDEQKNREKCKTYIEKMRMRCKIWINFRIARLWPKTIAFFASHSHRITTPASCHHGLVVQRDCENAIEKSFFFSIYFIWCVFSFLHLCIASLWHSCIASKKKHKYLNHFKRW
jgi:hypothetical protein